MGVQCSIVLSYLKLFAHINSFWYLSFNATKHGYIPFFDDTNLNISTQHAQALWAVCICDVYAVHYKIKLGKIGCSSEHSSSRVVIWH